MATSTRSNLQVVTPVPNPPEHAHATDFMSVFAKQFADHCADALVARLPKPNVIQPRYLTVRQAADYIGRSKKSFEYLMGKKLFPVIRHDRLVLIDKNDLDAFMARKKC